MLEARHCKKFIFLRASRNILCEVSNRNLGAVWCVCGAGVGWGGGAGRERESCSGRGRGNTNPAVRSHAHVAEQDESLSTQSAAFYSPGTSRSPRVSGQVLWWTNSEAETHVQEVYWGVLWGAAPGRGGSRPGPRKGLNGNGVVTHLG